VRQLESFSTLSRVLVLCNAGRSIEPCTGYGFQYPQSGISPLQRTSSVPGPAGSGSFSTLSRVLVLCNLNVAAEAGDPIAVSVPSVGY